MHMSPCIADARKLKEVRGIRVVDVDGLPLDDVKFGTDPKTGLPVLPGVAPL